jgi:hypothetical protein
MDGCSSLFRRLVVFVWAVMDVCGDQRDSFPAAPAARRQSDVLARLGPRPPM